MPACPVCACERRNQRASKQANTATMHNPATAFITFASTAVFGEGGQKEDVPNKGYYARNSRVAHQAMGAW